MTACILLSAALLINASACASSSDSTKASWDKRPCRPGIGHPISERTLKHILGTQGIRLYRDHGDCFGATDVRVLSSLSNAPIGLGYAKEEAVRVSQGLIDCDVNATDIFGSRIERFVWRNDSNPTYVRVLNVHCAISPDSRADTERLERAIRRLPGVSRLPTTLPSADAIHD